MFLILKSFMFANQMATRKAVLPRAQEAEWAVLKYWLPCEKRRASDVILKRFRVRKARRMNARERNRVLLCIGVERFKTKRK